MISLDFHGSMSPLECPWHVQHFSLDLVSGLQSAIVCLSVGRSLSFDSHQWWVDTVSAGPNPRGFGARERSLSRARAGDGRV